jgi:cyanophycinase
MRPHLLRAFTFIVWACAALLVANPAWAGGSVVVVGGALRDDNTAVWQRIVDLAGGPGARIAVLATASGEPLASAAAIVATLQRHGAAAEAIPVAPLIPGIDLAAAVRDPRWLERLGAAGGVFFGGGAQSRLVDTLQPGGRSTPLLDAIRAVHERGGVIAGTSSGAAVLSAVMFRDAPDVQAALREPLRDGIEVDRGFGFLPASVVVDQHFVQRGRIARLLPLMAGRGLVLGLGVEEDSAAVVQGTQVAVIGARGVVVADLSDAQTDAQTDSKGPAIQLRGVRLHWLESGDGYDLATRRAQTAKPEARRVKTARLAPALPQAAAANPADPAEAGVAFYPDLLAPGMLVTAMQRLVKGGRPAALGLSFKPGVALGFEWRFYPDADTQGWTGERSDQATVVGLRLDLRPVRMAQPLYTPLTAPLTTLLKTL